MAELLARGNRRPKGQIRTNSTEIAKIVQQSDEFGNTGIKKQQLTHRHLYHYLPFDGTTSLPFFENVKNAGRLFSNINTNQLQVGEVMIIKEFFFDLITVVPGSNPPAITNQNDFQTSGVPGLYSSQLQWTNDNNRVVKPIGLQQMNPKFNRNAFNNTLNSIILKADITVQPLIDFVAQLNLPTYTPVSNTFIGCHVLGIGTILAPKKVY